MSSNNSNKLNNDTLSYTILLWVFVHRVQGLANQLVRITDGEALTSLAYVSMLEQPVHVTSGFLLSSGDCAIEDQQISVNGSIRPAGDGNKIHFCITEDIMDVLQ